MCVYIYIYITIALKTAMLLPMKCLSNWCKILFQDWNIITTKPEYSSNTSWYHLIFVCFLSQGILKPSWGKKTCLTFAKKYIPYLVIPIHSFCICSYFYIHIYLAHCPMCRVFTNGLGDWGSIPSWVISKTQKMVLDTSLLNTQHLTAL